MDRQKAEETDTVNNDMFAIMQGLKESAVDWLTTLIAQIILEHQLYVKENCLYILTEFYQTFHKLL